MTLGTGIFSSTILLVLVAAIWQISLRQKWKLAGKTAAAIIAACAVIGGCFYAWEYIANMPPAPSVVTELAGVKLGASQSDVTLALGKPDTAADPTVQNGVTRIWYKYTSPDATILFEGADKYTVKATIICTDENLTKLLGFDNFESEDAVIQRLGKPDTTSISHDGLSKIISFPKWKSAFYITKGLVSGKCISQYGSVSFTDELLSPEAQKAADQKAAAEAKAQADQQAAEMTRPLAEQKAAKASSKLSAIISDNSDPCAPDLSKAERLRRLATFGTIRQTGSEDYQAGSHAVLFILGSLTYCR